MGAREELNTAKVALNISTDKELADILKTSKGNIDSWINRNKIPERWRLEISSAISPLAKLPIGSHAEEAPRQYPGESFVEEEPKPYEIKNPLPVDIANIVEILKELDTKQRRDVMRCVLEIEGRDKG